VFIYSLIQCHTALLGVWAPNISFKTLYLGIVKSQVGLTHLSAICSYVWIDSGCQICCKCNWSRPKLVSRCHSEPINL